MTSLNQCAGGFVNNGCDSEGSLQLLDGAPRLEQLFSSDHMYTKHNTEQCAVHADSRLVAWKLVLYMNVYRVRSIKQPNVSTLLLSGMVVL